MGKYFCNYHWFNDILSTPLFFKISHFDCFYKSPLFLSCTLIVLYYKSAFTFSLVCWWRILRSCCFRSSVGLKVLISVCILTSWELIMLNTDTDILIYLNHVLKLFWHGSMGITCRYAASYCYTWLLIQPFHCWKKKCCPKYWHRWLLTSKKMNKTFTHLS